MKINEYGLPRPHIIIDDVFSDDVNRKMLEEANSLPLKVGMMFFGEGDDRLDKRKKAYDIDLDKHYVDRKRSAILTAFDNTVWSDKFTEIWIKARYPIFNTLITTKKDNTHLIRYRDGDYYDFHTDAPTDVANKEVLIGITMSYMICKLPKKFEGGDFVIRYNDEEKIIEFKNNRLVLIPLYKCYFYAIRFMIC